MIKRQILYKQRRSANSERGAVLVTTMIILVLLTIIGVSGINMATTDLRITRNYKVYKKNFALADAATYSAVQEKLSTDYGDWIVASDNSTLVADKYFQDASKRPRVLNNINSTQVIQDWDSGSLGANAASVSSLSTSSEYIGIANPWNGNFVVLGRSRASGGDVTVEIGYNGTE